MFTSLVLCRFFTLLSVTLQWCSKHIVFSVRIVKTRFQISRHLEKYILKNLTNSPERCNQYFYGIFDINMTKIMVKYIDSIYDYTGFK